MHRFVYQSRFEEEEFEEEMSLIKDEVCNPIAFRNKKGQI